MLFHCLSNSHPSAEISLEHMFQSREVLTGCRCTHIMEVMFRIPTPIPTNNQDASRDERQVLWMRNSIVCNECRKIFLLPVSSDKDQNPLLELGKSSSLSELAEVCSWARRLRWSSTKPEPLNPWILWGNPANSSFPLHESLAMFIQISKPLSIHRFCQTEVNVINCFSRLQFQKSRWNPSWQTINHHPIN